MKMRSRPHKVKMLKSYSAPWKGEILLACGKCQRKLRKGEDIAGLGKLKKTLKRARRGLFVIRTPCLDVCPKGGVTVCTAEQVARGEFSILRTAADVRTLARSHG